MKNYDFIINLSSTFRSPVRKALDVFRTGHVITLMVTCIYDGQPPITGTWEIDAYDVETMFFGSGLEARTLYVKMMDGKVTKVLPESDVGEGICTPVEIYLKYREIMSEFEHNQYVWAEW